MTTGQTASVPYRTGIVGGQVPLLKHAIMQWLLAHNDGGNVPGDSYDVVRETRAAVPNVARALWDLQKQGLLTFVERKRAGTQGHASTTVLTHFNLTPKGLAWTPEKGYMDDLANVSSLSRDDLNPAAKDAVVLDEVVDEITADTPPAQALANLLRRAGGSYPIRRAHEKLGYKINSTAIYALTNAYPEAFHIHKGVVSFVGPDGWRAPTGPQFRTKNRAAPEAVVAKPVEEVQGFEIAAAPSGQPVAVPVPEPAKPGFPPRPIPERSTFPAIDALITREHKRLKAEEAAKTLESIGMDEQALSVLGAFPALSDIERDALTLAYWLGWTDG